MDGMAATILATRRGSESVRTVAYKEYDKGSLINDVGRLVRDSVGVLGKCG